MGCDRGGKADGGPIGWATGLTDTGHVSVLLDEVVRFLVTSPGGTWVDGTVGGGGHAEAVLMAAGPASRLVGLDKDQAALDRVAARLRPFGDRVILRHSDFSRMDAVLEELGIAGVDGVLLDLGVSSFQLDEAGRGFSFRSDAPLDMRMDRSSPVTAESLVNSLGEAELDRIIRDFGEERFHRRVARAIVAARHASPIRTTGQLAGIVRGVVRKGADNIDPATRTFQALRIAVNEELESLERGLEAALRVLRPGGRLAVISFHSLEDRMVKRFVRERTRGCRCPKDFPRCVCGGRPEVREITRKPVFPSDEEVRRNPRARSARLRVAEKLQV